MLVASSSLQDAAQSDVIPSELLTCTEDGSAGSTGVVTDLLATPLAAGKIDLLCACGPHSMLSAVDRLGNLHGIQRQLSWEAYMRCAVGICGSCELNGSVLCLDGPVLQHGSHKKFSLGSILGLRSQLPGPQFGGGWHAVGGRGVEDAVKNRCCNDFGSDCPQQTQLHLRIERAGSQREQAVAVIESMSRSRRAADSGLAPSAPTWSLLSCEG